MYCILFSLGKLVISMHLLSETFLQEPLFVFSCNKNSWYLNIQENEYILQWAWCTFESFFLALSNKIWKIFIFVKLCWFVTYNRSQIFDLYQLQQESSLWFMSAITEIQSLIYISCNRSLHFLKFISAFYCHL